MVQFQRKVKSATLETINGVEILHLVFESYTCNTTDKLLVSEFKMHKLVGRMITLNQCSETTEPEYNCMNRSHITNHRNR